MEEKNQFAIIEGERKNLGKIIWMAIFLIAVAAFIVYGPKKSFDFVKYQLSFALSPEEKWGIKKDKPVMEQKYGLIAAKDFHGTTDDLRKMSDEQLIFILETDRYGSDDDDVVLLVLKIMDEKAKNNLGLYGIKDQKLFERLQKVLHDILGTNNVSSSETLYAKKVLNELYVLYEF